MLADRVRMGSGSGSGNNDVSVNIQIKDISQYYSPIEAISIRPIIKGFELTPSDFNPVSGKVDDSRLSEIISLYCGIPIAIPRNSTINVATLKSKYFIIAKDGDVISTIVRLTNRNVTVEHLSQNYHRNSIFRLSENLEDGDIIEVNIMFD